MEKRQVYSEMLCLAGALSAVIAGAYVRSKYERNHFVVEKTVISSTKIKEAKTLVFLTDLHDKEFGRGNELLLQAVAGIDPALVLIGGDTMVTKAGLDNLAVTERLLRGLSRIAPVYYGNGNHEQRLKKEAAVYGNEYRNFLGLLKQSGAVYLADASVAVGADLRISGLDIDKPYYKDFFPKQMEREYLQRHLGPADCDRYQILLSHSPLFHRAYADWGADLSLTGHFHGGTIRVPVLGGVMTPQFQLFQPYCAGTFERDGRYMIAGRGLGTHSVNIRLNNLPQVVAVELQPER